MPISRADRARRKKAAGFSLVEISIVALIMAGLAALAAVNLGGRQEESLLLRDRALALAFLQGARDLAITSGKSVPVELKDNGKVLTAGPAPQRLLAFRGDAALAFRGNADVAPGDPFTFYPTGGSSGATLALASQTLETGLEIDWLSGIAKPVPVKAKNHAAP